MLDGLRRPKMSRAFSHDVVSEKRLGSVSLSVPAVLCRWRASSGATDSAIGGRAIRAAAATRVDVGRGQHAQQGRTAASATRPYSAMNPGDRPGVSKPIMHRCSLLGGLQIIHRKKTPSRRNATQTAGRRLTTHLVPGEPESLWAQPSWYRITDTKLAFDPGEKPATEPESRFRYAAIFPTIPLPVRSIANPEIAKPRL